jgi:hypothetical protein
MQGRSNGPIKAPRSTDQNAATLVTSADAIRQVFAWCRADSRAVHLAAGVVVGAGGLGHIADGLKSPSVIAPPAASAASSASEPSFARLFSATIAISTHNGSTRQRDGIDEFGNHQTSRLSNTHADAATAA